MNRISALTDEQCVQIYEAALRILETTGSEVKNEKALDLLGSIGADVNGTRVKITARIVEDALRKIPRVFSLYDTEGNPALQISANNKKIHWGCCLGTINIQDRKTKEIRPGTYDDVYENGLVIQALDNLDMAGGGCCINDRNPKIGDAYVTRALYETTKKPQIIYQGNVNELNAQLEMYYAIAGGKDEFVKKPFVLDALCPTAPLAHGNEALEKALRVWELGIPALYTTALMRGSTGPITIAGCLAVGLSEVLLGVVMSQAINPGTPFVGGAIASQFDMMNMGFSAYDPDGVLSGIAFIDICHYLGIPCKNALGNSDSPFFDEQAGGDAGTIISLAAMTQGNINTQVGFLESVNTFSLGYVVYENEMIGFMNRVSSGFDINAETLAESTIDAVGPQGNFLDSELTFRHFKENWIPQLGVRESFKSYTAKGTTDLYTRCNSAIDGIIQRGSVLQRDDKLCAELDRILANYDK